MFNNEVTVAGGVEFSQATSIATFLEDESLTLQPPNIVPRILWYSYEGTDEAVLQMVLSPSVAAAANFHIQLEGAAFTVLFVNFGRTGFIVPRSFGLRNDRAASQVINIAEGSPNEAAPYVMLASTVGKAATATIRVCWDYVDLGGGGL